jgi:hypothetical protein
LDGLSKVKLNPGNDKGSIYGAGSGWNNIILNFGDVGIVEAPEETTATDPKNYRGLDV